MAKRIHIIIAEPSAMIRSGMASILLRSAALNTEVIELSDISLITNINTRQTPDVLIVNPHYTGSMTLAQMRAETDNRGLKIIALQSSFADQTLLQGFDEVITIYESTESIVDKIIETAKDSDESDKKRELSAREKEIIVSIVKGLTNKQIADSLNLSTHTVIAHRRNIANKLKIHSPSGLTIYAIVNKLVDIADVKNSITSEPEEV